MIDEAEEIVGLIREKKLDPNKKQYYIGVLEEAVSQCDDIIRDSETDRVGIQVYYNKKVLYLKAKNKINSLWK